MESKKNEATTASGKKLIILDTNFLLIPYQFHIDVFSELNYLLDRAHEMIVPNGVKEELSKLASKKGRAALAARLALKILEVNKKSIKIVSSNGNVDSWILNFAKDNNAIICTNDKELRMRARKEKLKVITMKTRTKIDFI